MCLWQQLAIIDHISFMKAALVKDAKTIKFEKI